MILRDPVHGLISFTGPALSIVPRLLDCAEVQRLRRIRALGLASFAYPGAEHSRFAHALGSAYVMKRYLERVWDLARELPERDRIDNGTAMVALAAALLHDLGHGPYSHTFETVLKDSPPHEEWTSRIILDPDTEVHKVLAEIDGQMPRMVERLVHGHSPIPHLARAVSGTFDVDRCDYLKRDSYMTGVRYGLLDLDWLLQSLRLYAPEGGASVLAVDGNKGLTAVEGFFLTRLYMYRQVYLHKAVRAAEYLVRGLFSRLLDLGPQPGTPPAMAKLLRGEPLSVADYLRLDDRALEYAVSVYADSHDPVLRQLASDLLGRRLFKTMQLRADVDSDVARARLDEVLARHDVPTRYFGAIDRVEILAYRDDDASGQGLMVLRGRGQLRRLVDVSPVIHGLSRETYVHHRAVYPRVLRDEVGAALTSFT